MGETESPDEHSGRNRTFVEVFRFVDVRRLVETRFLTDFGSGP